MDEHRYGRGVTRLILLAVAVAATASMPSGAMAAGASGVAELERRVQVDMPYPYFGVPLLSGFHLQFPQERRCSFYGGCSTRRVDKRIRKIEIAPRSECEGRLAVTFRDDSGDDPFRYSVRHHSYGTPSRRTHRASLLCEVNVSPDRPCRLPLERPSVGSLGDAVFVLVGFSLELVHSDDEIWPVGVRRDGDAIAVDFGHAGEAGYAYHGYQADVDYAWVPRRALRAMGVSSGVVENDSGTVVPSDIPPGDVVIRGFHLAFTGRRDHNLNRIGVLAPGDHVPPRTVTLADKGHDENFTWAVEWAILDRPLAARDAIYREVPAAASP
jgi:hypothetical protein